MARAIVNTNLGPAEPVQTVARPSGISAPVATVGPSPAMSLVESLVKVQPELSAFIQDATNTYREDEANRAYDTIQGMTYDEAKAAVASGEMRKTESPWFRAAFQKQFGLATASERRREIVTAYNNSFDKENGDINSFLANYAKQDYSAYGQSEFILAGLREGMGGVFDDVKNKHAEYIDGQLQTRAAENFYTIARDTVAATAEAGGDVNAAITNIVAEHTSSGLLDPDQTDAALLGLAEEYAMSGDVASLEAVLAADPNGRGSFSSRAGFSTKAITLREQAAASAADSARKASIEPRANLEIRARTGLLDDKDREQITAWVENGVMTPDAAEGLYTANTVAEGARLSEATEANARSALLKSATELVISGQGAAVQDTTITLPDGTTKKVTGTELRSTVLNEQMTVLMSGPNPSIAVAAQHMASWAVPETFKPWEDSLTNGYRALTGALTKPDKDGNLTLPDPAKAAYLLWREMSGADKVREMHVKDATAAAVYRDAETLEEVGGMTPEEALFASASIDRSSSRTSLSSRVDTDTFEQAVADHMSGDWFGSAPINAQIVKTAVEEHARILMDMNIPQDKAIKKALERFDSSFTEVGGVYINTRDRYVPSDIAAVSESYIAEYRANNPNADEVYFVPDRNQDYWTLTDQFGAPLRGAPRIHISALSTRLQSAGLTTTNTAITGKP